MCTTKCKKGFILSYGQCHPIPPCLTTFCPKEMECGEVTVKSASGQETKVCKGRCGKDFIKSGNECVKSHPCQDFACPTNANCKPKGDECVPTCPEGTELVASRNTCVRKNVCNTFSCPDKAVCSPSVDGTQCLARCLPGYTPAGSSCIPESASVDECSQFSCPAESRCVVFQGRCIAFLNNATLPAKPAADDDDEDDDAEPQTNIDLTEKEPAPVKDEPVPTPAAPEAAPKPKVSIKKPKA
jgi:hypothetical protein